MRMPAFEIWLRTMGVSLSVVIALATSPAGLAAAGNQAVSQAPTADQIVNQLQENGGVFPGSNPYAWDDGTPIRGMALMFLQADGQQWRTAMNAVPFFPVATPAANYEFLKAQQPLPTTGDPDPKKLAAFFASHPTANAFRIWDRTTKPSASYATVQYNSLDAFEFVDARGRRQAVRWSMVPEAIADGRPAPTDQPDFLAADLRQRLSQAPLRWRLVVTLANPGDRVNEDRK